MKKNKFPKAITPAPSPDYFMVKNIVTGKVVPMLQETFDALCANKSLLIKDEEKSTSEEIVMKCRFEKTGEVVDKHRQNKEQRIAFDKKYIKIKKHKFKQPHHK